MTTTPDLPLLETDHAWAVVDVETSGFQPGTGGRVLSVAALALDAAGRPERRFSTLLDPGVDPGPVHVHGLTRERLAGAPTFEQIAPELLDVLDGRILVAHNAAFDHRFLTAELDRAGLKLPVEQRLCTLALSRRLGLAVPDHKLGTLADYWGVTQRRAHEARDDVEVLARILTHSLLLAARLDLPLPLVGGDAPVSAVPTAPRCPWRNPGRLDGPLVQGMRVAVTGALGESREAVAAQLVDAGLDVTRSVSRLTSVLVTNHPTHRTRKAERARAEGVPVIDEATLRRLLTDVRPGIPAASHPGSGPAGGTIAGSSAAEDGALSGGTAGDSALVSSTAVDAASRSDGLAGSAARAVATQRRTKPRGPLHGRRILVLGGTHAQAADVRTEITAQGGGAAINFTAGVTDVILMAGGEADRRLSRIRESGLPVHTGPAAFGIALPAPVLGEEPPVADVEATGGRHRGGGIGADVPVMVRGEVADLPAGVWTVNAAWRADAPDVDVVAFLVDADERVVADEDFVFYNAPVSEHGAVSLSVDGDSEQSVRVDLDLVEEQHTRIVIAAALAGAATFGDLGAVTVAVDGDLVTAATTTLDAGTTERTMLLAEIYRRGGSWRLRAVGQGYDDGLAELAVRYGVDVEG